MSAVFAGSNGSCCFSSVTRILKKSSLLRLPIPRSVAVDVVAVAAVVVAEFTEVVANGKRLARGAAVTPGGAQCVVGAPRQPTP